MSKVEEVVETLIKNKIEELNYELYDVLYLKEGSNKILRIVIDNKTGITINDCEKVNNEIKGLIDEADPIQEQYFLEVSSPGIERVLRKDWQLKRFINSNVNIRLFNKDQNGKKEYIGILLDVNDEYLKIKSEEEIKIARKEIAIVKTIYDDKI